MVKIRRNMNIADRLFRGIVGIAILSLGPAFEVITTDGLSNAILGIVGITALLSAAFSYCFLYDITGFSSSKREASK